MKSLSPQRRDMLAVIALVIIICIAFPLIGSLAGSRVPPPSTRTPTLAPTPPIIPTPAEEPTPTPEANSPGDAFAQLWVNDKDDRRTHSESFEQIGFANASPLPTV